MDKSIELFNKAKLLMPGGVNSPVRAFKNINGNPIFFDRAEGAYLFDADGNKYIDYIGSWGPMIMGHSHPAIVNAIKEQAERGTSYGAPTSLESDVASLIIQCIPSIEKIRMVNSGTEATMSAIRLARGFTNKDKIIKFEGCYHGHVDSLLIKAGSGVSTFGLPDSPGIPKDLAKHTVTCKYNDIEGFLAIFNSIRNDLAAVIVEPIAGNMGFVPGNHEFLETLRECTQSNGSLLIFDEVMSGFRVSLGGAQEIFNIEPDLTALGKVIGGGLPVGAFGGKAKIMNYLAPEGPVYQAGTLSGNPLAMAAGSTLLKLLIKDNPYQMLEMQAKKLLSGIKKVMDDYQVPFSTNQIGGMFGFFFSTNLPQNINDVSETCDKTFSTFLNACIKNGIYFAPSKYEAGFISTQHAEDEIDKTIKIVANIASSGELK
ncbi:MAG: glutamate-1-semialdehyde 2,1-aminomutase [Proteobacteria bacterium]|uniref:Glutamate-1-semialdehyde 2,1-aminomutase n=1 Tax=SAR86 cluster bacterium TaxID=2030880 RepID=A0A937IGP2_9GAMM|nr:glutamate-1-semialdehyde 2,1-aminomutase [SAR86 cluster bacterium]MDA0775487.1 glutamate-1-semialdehyde 2,1-aminomutase [Pseudomonadota bacterium]MDA0976323.1 glutamate-1-semialdehyde 2,1-aminomutase [Pseudomonadota bacterium]MDA1037557.1 glutamate-1-semialdehyde 2,1-aminomutase [Pseudomonadota bacterium]